MDLLIVEDDETLQELSRGIATHNRWTVTVAASAEEAQRHWKKNHLLLLDLQLPRMQGIELCHWIRKQPNGEQPFICICTTNNSLATFQNARAAGANDYLIKPINPLNLTIRLEYARNHLTKHLHSRATLKPSFPYQQNAPFLHTLTRPLNVLPLQARQGDSLTLETNTLIEIHHSFDNDHTNISTIHENGKPNPIPLYTTTDSPQHHQFITPHEPLLQSIFHSQTKSATF